MNDDKDYKEIILKRAIILCWVLLIICFIIKLCGGNYFNIMCNNENFIRFCNFIENSIIKYIIYLFSFIFSSYLLLKIVKPDFKILSLKSLLFLICCIIVWAFKLLIELNIFTINTLIVNILDFVILYVLLVIFTKRPLLSIFAVILLFVFSIISSLVKGIGIDSSITDNYFVAQIFLIDYYLMLVLSVLYSKKIQIKKKERVKWD